MAEEQRDRTDWMQILNSDLQRVKEHDNKTLSRFGVVLTLLGAVSVFIFDRLVPLELGAGEVGQLLWIAFLLYWFVVTVFLLTSSMEEYKPGMEHFLRPFEPEFFHHGMRLLTIGSGIIALGPGGLLVEAFFILLLVGEVAFLLTLDIDRWFRQKKGRSLPPDKSPLERAVLKLEKGGTWGYYALASIRIVGGAMAVWLLFGSPFVPVSTIQALPIVAALVVFVGLFQILFALWARFAMWGQLKLVNLRSRVASGDIDEEDIEDEYMDLYSGSLLLRDILDSET